MCAVALVGAVTGCGSSSTTTKHATPTPKSTTTSTVPLAVKLREAIAACRKQVAKDHDIPASEQPIARADCNGIKTGNIAPLRAVLLRACQRTVARLPAADQGPASLACKKVY